MSGAVLFLRDVPQQFLAAGDERGQPLLGGRERGGGDRGEDPAVFSQDGGIEGVALGEQTLGPGELARQTRVEAGDRHLGSVGSAATRAR